MLTDTMRIVLCITGLCITAIIASIKYRRDRARWRRHAADLAREAAEHSRQLGEVFANGMKRIGRIHEAINNGCPCCMADVWIAHDGSWWCEDCGAMEVINATD